MPAQLQSHPSVCGFYTIYAAFQRFKFCQEEITRVQGFNVFSFTCNYFKFFNVFVVYVQSLRSIRSNFSSLISFFTLLIQSSNIESNIEMSATLII